MSVANYLGNPPHSHRNYRYAAREGLNTRQRQSFASANARRQYQRIRKNLLAGGLESRYLQEGRRCTNSLMLPLLECPTHYLHVVAAQSCLNAVLHSRTHPHQEDAKTEEFALIAE